MEQVGEIGRSMKWAASICAVVIVLTLCAWALFHAFTSEARATARGFAQQVFSVLHLQPQVTVKNSVVVQQSRDIAELATETQTLSVETDFAHTYLGSTKRLHLRGQFTVKAGFNLQKDFRVSVADDGKAAIADFPAPEVLSVEAGKYDVLEDSSGWWNYLTPADREAALQNLLAKARSEAVESGLLAKARASLTQQLQQAGEARGARWEVRFRDVIPEPRPLFPQP